MRKILDILQRSILALGVIVALTPCQVCKAPSAGPTMAHCPMASMGGHRCCHTKKMDPLCKVMDQSSTQVVPGHVDAPVAQLSVMAFVPPVFFAMAVPSRTVAVIPSPPRSSPILRI